MEEAMESPDSAEGLAATIAEAKRAIADYHIDVATRREWHTTLRCAEDRLAAMQLAGHLSNRPTIEPPQKALEKLLARCVKLMDGDQAEGKVFLDAQLTRNGINPETYDGLDWGRLTSVSNVLTEFEQATKNLKPSRPKPKKEEPPKMSLFKNLKTTDQGVVNTATGEVSPPIEIGPEKLRTPQEIADRKRIMEEARAALGIPYATIDTKEKYEKIMRRRCLAILEYVQVYTASQKILNDCMKEINDIDTAYQGELQQYYERNKPAGKKTLAGLYGDLGERSQAESLALDDSPEGPAKFKAWVASRPKAAREMFGIVERVEYDRNLDAIKSWWFKQPEKERMASIPPGMRYSPAKENFSIRPSIDTIKETAKKEPEKYVTKYGEALGQ